MIKACLLIPLCFLLSAEAYAWGFFGHRMINQYAVYLLPPDMMVLYKPHIDWLAEHAVDPDKRRYAIPAEAPRHFMDMDHYRPWDSIPASWARAVERYGADSLEKHGLAPWWIQAMMARLTEAFAKKDLPNILRLSADLGHYVGDIHVPLHASSNHNGQHTGQQGIHGLWESRLPELFALTEYDLITGKAGYIRSTSAFAWRVIRESASAADTVLRLERQLTLSFRANGKYAFEERNGLVLRQYSAAYSRAYDNLLNGMVERRLRASILAVAGCWYTAWVNAGQPDLKGLAQVSPGPEDKPAWDELNQRWKQGGAQGRSCSN